MMPYRTSARADDPAADAREQRTFAARLRRSYPLPSSRRELRRTAWVWAVQAVGFTFLTTTFILMGGSLELSPLWLMLACAAVLSWLQLAVRLVALRRSRATSPEPHSES